MARALITGASSGIGKDIEKLGTISTGGLGNRTNIMAEMFE